MRISGKELAQNILENLKQEIVQNDLQPGLAIVLASNDPASLIYVNNKLKAAEEVGINANLYKFSDNLQQECLDKINELNKDESVSGIIVQYPVYEAWDFDDICSRVSLEKDVDGFLPNSPFYGATALGVWEMLKKFASVEGYDAVENFLNGKKIVMIGKGRAAGKPTIRLLQDKGFEVEIVDSKTENPEGKIGSGDVVISATGKKHIVGSNIKDGAYVIGVGVGREDEETFGDIDEEEVSKKAKLYCPTIGGIGPLTVACLLKNVVEASKRRDIDSYPIIRL